MASSSSSGGLGIGGVLFLIFLVLKLAEVGVVARWSWWWVCSPLWIPLVVIVPIIGTIYVFGSVSDWRARRRYLRSQMDD